MATKKSTEYSIVPHGKDEIQPLRPSAKEVSESYVDKEEVCLTDCPVELQLFRRENILIPACYFCVGVCQGKTTDGKNLRWMSLLSSRLILLYLFRRSFCDPYTLGLNRPLLNAYPLDLGATEAQQATVALVVMIPATLKIVFGFLSDNFPIFGYRRKSYMLIGWLSATFMMMLLYQSTDLTMGYDLDSGHARPPGDAPSVEFLSLSFLGFGIGMWMWVQFTLILARHHESLSWKVSQQLACAFLKLKLTFAFKGWRHGRLRCGECCTYICNAFFIFDHLQYYAPPLLFTYLAMRDNRRKRQGLNQSRERAKFSRLVTLVGFSGSWWRLHFRRTCTANMDQVPSYFSLPAHRSRSSRFYSHFQRAKRLGSGQPNNNALRFGIRCAPGPFGNHWVFCTSTTCCRFRIRLGGSTLAPFSISRRRNSTRFSLLLTHFYSLGPLLTSISSWKQAGVECIRFASWLAAFWVPCSSFWSDKRRSDYRTFGSPWGTMLDKNS